MCLCSGPQNKPRVQMLNEVVNTHSMDTCCSGGVARVSSNEICNGHNESHVPHAESAASTDRSKDGHIMSFMDGLDMRLLRCCAGGSKSSTSQGHTYVLESATSSRHNSRQTDSGQTSNATPVAIVPVPTPRDHSPAPPPQGMGLKNPFERRVPEENIVLATIQSGQDDSTHRQEGVVKETPPWEVEFEALIVQRRRSEVGFDTTLGLSVDFSDEKTLLIEGIQSRGAVAKWNKEHPDRAIVLQDRIIAANDVSGDADLIVRELQTRSPSLKLKIRRG